MADKIRLTERKIADLIPTPGKQYEVWDQEQPRFGIRVSPGGRKVFFVLQRVNGRIVRSTVGVFPEKPLKDARRDAAALLVSMQSGINPNIDKKQKRIENTDKRGILSAVFESYLASGGLDGNIKNLTKRGYRYNFKHLQVWESKRVEDITPALVKKRFEEITRDSGTYAANRAMGLLHYLMSYSIKNLKRPTINPVADIKFHKESPRRVNVAPETMPAFIAALDNIKGDSGSDLYKLLLFTGLRKSNAMELKWSAIDLDKKTLYVAVTKNGEPLYIPLSAFVVGMLTTRKAKTQGSLWVFPSQSRTGHLTNTSNFDRQITEQGVKISPHMLRKRYTTTAKLICPGFVVDILTSHVPTGSVTDKNYTIPSPEELRPFVEQITAELLRLAGIVAYLT